MDNILVSICCLAYNQENYIAQTLQSFVEQITDFPFEVLVHDDASKDGTADIIRSFAEKYPLIIKPICQTENQYSQRVPINAVYQYPRARGKYLAFCEGDDYWLDPHKLQKQVDYMESHPDCSLCFTNGKCEESGVVDRRVIPWNPAYRNAYKSTGDYDMGEMALLDYVPTASLLCRTEQVRNMPQLAPTSFRGDTYIRLYLTSLGYAHLIDEDTCLYRYRVEGSVTTQWYQSNTKAAESIQRIINLLDDMDRMTNGRYTCQLEQMRLRCQFRKLIKLCDYRAARGKEFHRLFRGDGKSEYFKYLLAVYSPRLYPAVRNLSRKLRGKK